MDVCAVRMDFDRRLESPVFERLIRFTAPEKQERLRRFYREEDRLRGLYGDLLLRDLVRRRTGLANEDIVFTPNQYGKPFLKDRSDVQFNLSHSGNWVVACIDSQPVGIDVEAVQPIDLSISENYFSPDEHRELMNKPDPNEYFFTLWALKESYIKILGKGLSHPLNAFSINFDPSGEIVINVRGQRIGDIHFREYSIDKGYKMAVCGTHDGIPGRAAVITADRLIRSYLT